MQAVLMVAGKSTRTYPLTLTRPKPLLPLANKTLIAHILDQMTGLFDEVILIVGYKKEMIMAELGDSYKGIHLVYCDQKEQKGTGHAVLQAKPYINGKFVAMNGDDVYSRQDMEQLVKFDYAALVKTAETPSLHGIYQVDKDNKVLDLVEKPEKYIGNLANIGCYVLKSDFFNVLENTPLSKRGEIEITSAILDASRKEPFYVVPATGFWLPVAYPWDLLKHQEFILSGKTGFKPSEFGTDGSSRDALIEDGVFIEGAVTVGENTVIKSGTRIEGPVIIGNGCTLGPNLYIRSNTSIGNNCRIGNAVEIKASIIMDGCSISHLSYIGDSIIGEGSNIGAGTITANHRHDWKEIRSTLKDQRIGTKRKNLGTIMADGVKTGIHTSIYPGIKIWPEKATIPGTVLKNDLTDSLS
jgi:UDP-N-acetylglucosamine diphosphorylase / glucose-1-phosphate thymidylyltransferase / UDP-N-acetylgalactosamine diphosphorylase / glucosamine-1-phosphate N-acetyltransferase / galactosamine-1-phosphate N-acetyltransferase